MRYLRGTAQVILLGLALVVSPAWALTCGPIYASKFSNSGFSTQLYQLSGATASAAGTATKNFGAISQASDTNIYFENGDGLFNVLKYTGSATSSLGTKWTNMNGGSGPGGAADGNNYFVGSNYHLYKVSTTGTPTDVGALVSTAGDSVFTSLKYGDVASDANGRLMWYTSVGGNSTSYLYRIDKNTLKATNLGAYGPAAASGAAFDTTGKLITTAGAPGVTSSSTAYSIDLSSGSLSGTNLGSVTGLGTGYYAYDLASCAFPTFDPNLSMTKTAANITQSQNPATSGLAGDVLEYTITITNTGNLAADSTTISDAIPNGTTYVAGSTTLNGAAVADVAGKMPYDPTGSGTREVHSTGQAAGIVLVGAANAVVVKFKVKINTSGLPATITNQATISFPQVASSVTTFVSTSSNNSNITISASPTDYSDAPASFGAPSHIIASGYKLGSAAPDAEAGANPTTNANGDDTTGTDDEDGVTIPALTQGQNFTITATASGAGGYLQGWIDWNGNGTFDTTEKIATNLQDNGTGDSNAAAGTLAFAVSVPSSAVTTQTYARFRWSTTSSLDATTAANDGEVEDYSLSIAASVAATAIVPQTCGGGFTRNYGASATPTNSLPAGSSTTYNPYSPMDGGLGDGEYTLTKNPDLVDDFGGGYNNQWHNGTDHTGNTDGLMLVVNAAPSTGTFYRESYSGLIPGVRYRFSVYATNMRPLDGGAGDLPNVTLSVTPSGGGASIATSNTGPIPETMRATGLVWHQYGVAFVATATSHDVVLSNNQLVGANGNDLALDDISISLDCDYGDAPDTATGTSAANYQTNFSDDGAAHIPYPNIRMGTLIDSEPMAQPNATATGDNLVESNDEDGVTLPASFSINVPTTVSVGVTGTNGRLQGWVDWNGDGDFNDNAEQVITNLADNSALDTNAATGTISVVVTPPTDAVNGASFARFRWSTVSSLTPTGTALDGEIEDYVVTTSNTAPIITSNGGGASAAISMLENGTTATFVSATDANGDTLTYSITGGADASKFSINPNTGLLTFNAAPDYEAPTDAGADNTYDVQVTVVDGKGGTAVQTIAVSVTNDPENVAPVISSDGAGSSAALSVAENQTAVTTVAATDANASDTLTYSISGGADAAKFAIDSSTGVLTFVAAPDFEAPSDADANNVYDVQVSVSDGSLNDAQDLAVTVTDVADNLDFGDAPASFGSPSHIITAGINLGATVDAETAPPTPLDGTGDDATGTDDEDGVYIPTLTQGYKSFITVKVTGTGSYLQGWADWNGNGVFDTGEQIATDIQDNGTGDINPATGIIEISVSVPSNATTATTYARFRWSNTAGLNATDAAATGEVEDYPITVKPAPSSTPVYTGTTPSSCTFDNVLWYNTQTELRNYNLATNTDTLKRSLTHAYGDIAWAADGKLYGIEYLSFTNPAPQTFASAQNANPTLYRLYQIDPVAGTETLIYSGNDIVYGNSLSSDNKNWLYFGSGFRQGGTGPFTTGKSQMNNRIYRYQPGGTSAPQLWIDLGDYGYSNGHPGGDFLFMGSYSYVLWATPENAGTTSEILKIGPLDSNNEVTAATTVSSLGSVATTLFGLTGNNLGILYSISGGADKTVYQMNPSPFSATPIGTATAAAWGLTSTVEANAILCLGQDHGDAPVSYGDAAHSIINPSTVYLGTNAPDMEASASAPLDGTGDDVTGTDDEDGVVIPQMWAGAQTQLSVSVAGSGGYLQAWFDWNGNGTFEAGEQVASNLQDATATSTSDLNAAAGVIDFVVTPPANAVLTQTYARFRWSTTNNLDATSAASDGEVEDYAFTVAILPNQVCNDTPWHASNPTPGETINLYEMTFTGGIVTLTELPDPVGTPTQPLFYYNLAYRSQDGYFYGLASTGNGTGSFNSAPTLVKIGGNGARAAMGWPVGMALGSTSATFGSDGYLYANSPTGDMNKIDVTTSPPTLLSTTTVTPSIGGPQDIILSADNQWAYGFHTVAGGAQFARLDVTQTTGTWQLIGPVFPSEGGKPALGAIFRDNTGAIYATHNGTGKVYRVILARENTATPSVTFTLVASPAGVFSGYNHDGTFCATQLFPVAIPTDYSDAPVSYGAPSHKIATGLQLGTGITDAESSATPSVNADSDNLTGTNDEDGFTFSDLKRGVAVTLTTTVQGKNGYLQGWIDWNKNGVFDASEQIATNVEDGGTDDTNPATGQISLSVTVPSTAVLGQTYARFRWSTIASLDAVSIGALDGEVEDYAVNIANDAPVITSDGGAATAPVSAPENQTVVTLVTATDANTGDTLTYSITGGADAAKFVINATSGLLTFAVAPDFETPTDAGANNVYDVQVTVADGNGGTDVQDIAVTVTDVAENVAPVITSNGGAATAAVGAAENQTAVTTVVATDANASDTLTYSITGGADSAKFAINSSTGVLTFVAAPDFETPTDVGTDNVYDVQVTVTDNGSLTDVQDIAVTVADIPENGTPAITSGGGGATAAVGVPENQTTAMTVTATDTDVGDTLTYSITGGADAAKFAIDASTGVLTFVAAPDFETPTDVGTDNVYDVQVTVTDNGSLTDVQDIAVTVTDVAENVAPVITSNSGGATASTSAAENQTAVTTVTATDANAGDTLTYSISGGADAGKFAIDSSTGVLTFVTAPDFEVPTDAGTDNVYDVQVTVTDTGSLTDVQDIAVTVTDVAENVAPVITSNGGAATAPVSAAENQTAVTTVTATDANAGDTLTYSITGGADAAKFAIDASTGVLTFVTAPDFEAPTDAGADNVYDVQVTVTDTGSLTDVQDIAVTVTDVAENVAPVITSNGGAATAAVSAAENQTAVTTVTATDANAGDTLTYTISGGADAAKFAIDSSTGVLTFIAAPDFEAPTDAGADNVYDVQVTVTDNGSLTDVQDIAVTVTDVAENVAPVITSNGGAATAAVGAAENQTAVTTVTATDANAGDTLTYTITGGADSAKFAIDSSTGVLTFVTAPDFEVPTDAGADNVYDVQVTVTDNGSLTDVQDIAVTVTDVAEMVGSVQVQVKALLQGPYAESTGLMQDTLRSLNLIPTAQPYSIAPFYHSGTETVSAATLANTGTTAVVDWVLVELRTATAPTSTIATQAALLLRNGSIADASTGSTNLTFASVAAGNYYIAVRHRNHLGVLTASTVTLSSSPTLVDFTLTSTPTYGTDARLEVGTLALLWGGDANTSNQVIAAGPGDDNSSIIGSLLTYPANTSYSSNYRLGGYLKTDLDLNGLTIFAGPGNDVNLLMGNVILHPANSTGSANFVIGGHLPLGQ